MFVPALHTKNNSRQIISINVTAKNIKHLEENIGENLHDLWLGNDIIDMIPKAQAIREKLINWILSDQSFCTSEDAIRKMKGQATEWVKIFSNCMSDKCLVSRIYKEINVQ